MKSPRSFFDACLNGKLTIAQKILDENPDLDINTTYYNHLNSHKETTAFMIACEKGHLDIVKWLIDFPKLDINAKKLRPFNTGWTDNPLVLACQNEHIEIVALLLKHSDLDINITSSGATALSAACEQGNDNLTKLLLSHPKLNTSVKNDVLFKASQNGKTDIVKLLLADPDVDINYIQSLGYPSKDYSPLTIALLKGHDEIVKLLLNYPTLNINQANDEDGTAFFIACNKGNIEVVDLFLNRPDLDLNISPRNEKANQTTPLLAACAEGYIEIAKLFLNHPNLDIRNILKRGINDLPGLHCLFKACEKGYANIVELLLSQSELDVNQKSKEHSGETSLHLACRKGHGDIVQLLLNHPKIDVNVKNNYGGTIMDACMSHTSISDFNTIQLLLDDPRIDRNWSHVLSATLHKSSEILKLFLIDKRLKFEEVDLKSIVEKMQPMKDPVEQEELYQKFSLLLADRRSIIKKTSQVRITICNYILGNSTKFTWEDELYLKRVSRLLLAHQLLENNIKVFSYETVRETAKEFIKSILTERAKESLDQKLDNAKEQLSELLPELPNVIKKMKSDRQELDPKYRNPAELFVMMVCLCDKIFSLKTESEETKKMVRFFKIAEVLPLDLQQVLSNRTYGMRENIISFPLTESTLRKVLKKQPKLRII